MSDTSRAIEAWRQLLGDAAVLEASEASTFYKGAMFPERQLAGALKVFSRSQVPQILRIAAEHSVPLSVISTGKNWGYGGAAPARDGCVLVDLSALTAIEAFDEELGLITVEPGVTQQQLFDYIAKQGDRYFVPLTGSSPHCSLIGNALERGFGLTPSFDHFGAVTWLEAVLADGSVYRSPPTGESMLRTARSYRHGVGPYLDGLFAQSGLGVVTLATLQLVPKTADSLIFAIRPHTESAFDRLLPRLRECLGSTAAGAVNLKCSNENFLCAATEASPTGGQEWSSNPWSAWGVVFGEPETVSAARRILGRKVSGLGELKAGRISTLKRLRKMFGFIARATNRFDYLLKVGSIIDLVEGKPSGSGLRLLYPKDRWPSIDFAKIDPLESERRIFWYPAIVPFHPDDMRAFRNFSEEVCARHGFTPYSNASAVSESSFIAILALVYQASEGIHRAQDCYGELLEKGVAYGFLPYRANIDSMNRVMQRGESESTSLADRLRSALDPAGIVSPGRY